MHTDTHGFFTLHHEASVLQPRPAKVQEQANSHTCCLQVIKKLCFVNGIEATHGLAFKEDATLDNQVCLILTHDDPIVANLYGFLFFHSKPNTR